MIISKSKLRNYLTEVVTNNILQSSEEDLYSIIRYDGIKGFEQYEDKELFKILQDTVPEFDLTECVKTDSSNIFLGIKKEHENNAEDIKIDITRIIQMKMLG